MFSLEISWNSSDQDANNIKLLDYRITLIDGTTLKQVFTYTAITRTSLVIENLARNRTYIAEIQARNEVGYGKTANVTATTLLAGKGSLDHLFSFALMNDVFNLLVFELLSNSELNYMTIIQRFFLINSNALTGC